MKSTESTANLLVQNGIRNRFVKRKGGNEGLNREILDSPDRIPLQIHENMFFPFLSSSEAMLFAKRLMASMSS